MNIPVEIVVLILGGALSIQFWMARQIVSLEKKITAIVVKMGMSEMDTEFLHKKYEKKHK